ncbi:BTB/POZ domain-containing protein POB1-like [Dendronephthya gigantea]|uniref:BTB/POZ domain-containing protein POB1-like n=1 Tax=Dendronephthya gigantea TaxID=151771 RepID=UPI00106A0F57|nr:BTB/POZ domain-containing protein POB1-like [Dendronephthya gigantea]
MAEEKENFQEVSSNAMKFEDLHEFSNIFASEFNNNSIHDRVLCFEILDCEDSVNEKAETLLPCDSETIPTNCKPVELETQVDSSECGDQSDEKQTCIDESKKSVKTAIEEMSLMSGMKKGPDYAKEDCERPCKEDDSKISEAAIVEEKIFLKKLYVHSQWLAVQSPYFKALFYSGMKESYTKDVVMKVHENEIEAHTTLIEAMYTLDVLNGKDLRLVVKTFVLANKYDVSFVAKKCKYVMLSSRLDMETCEYILEEIENLSNTEDLFNMIEQFLVEEFTPIDKTWTMDKFSTLSEASLKLLLSSDSLAILSENTIFVALMKWVDLHVPRYERDKCDLLKVVRFQFMSVDFLYDVVQHHVVAKQMRGFNSYVWNGLAYHGFSHMRREKLEDKPIERPILQEKDPTFSWKVDEELDKKLSNSRGKSSYSTMFWFKGYSMELELAYLNDSKHCRFYLRVLHMRKGAYLNLSCTAKSNLFANRSIQIKQLFTDESNAWGYQSLKRSTIPLGKFYTIDVWMKSV